MAVTGHLTVSINAAADADNTVIAAVAGKRIRVISYVISNVTTAGLVIFRSGAAGTEHARFNMLLGQAIVYAGDEAGEAFDCDLGAAFVINNGAGVDTLGTVTYTIE